MVRWEVNDIGIVINFVENVVKTNVLRIFQLMIGTNKETLLMQIHHDQITLFKDLLTMVAIHTLPVLSICFLQLLGNISMNLNNLISQIKD